MVVSPSVPTETTVVAIADLPTEFGRFQLVGFAPVALSRVGHRFPGAGADGRDHVAIVKGDVAGARDVPVRLHSECLTGDVLGSLRCDCRQQLHGALEAVAGEERGVVLYLRQEGRGIGLLNKIRAYRLQERGLDTVDANQALGFDDDLRDYTVAADMIRALGIESVRLMTNNPDKIRQLEALGVPVSGRIPHVMPSNQHNAHYLATKAARSGHLLGDEIGR